ncbi:hypothetical protein BCD67_13390 [Oscillatoriales cyanobacterium USR001]|nr:hypothetical protein BCD67_13390 [Oscillatoriales cyanobacterium USR001]
MILLASFTLVSILSLPAHSVEQVVKVRQLSANLPVFPQKSLIVVDRSAFTPLLISQTPNTLQLEQEGKKFYELGQFSEAEKLWQKAADAYEKLGDREGVNRSLINKSEALQALGLYPKACNVLLQVLGIGELDCKELIKKTQVTQGKIDSITQEDKILQERLDSLFKTIEKQPDSLNKATALRRIGDVFRQINDLELSEKVLLLSKTVAQSLRLSQEESAALLSLGNTALVKGKRQRNQKSISKLAEDIVDLNKNRDLQERFNQIPREAYLSDYQPALNFYQAAANLSASPVIKIHAKLNHLSLLSNILLEINQELNRISQSKIKIGTEEQSLLEMVNSYLNQESYRLVSDISSQISSFPNNRAGIYARINFAKSLIILSDLKVNSDAIAGFQEIKTLLDDTLKKSQLLGEKRAEFNALGSLGELYEQQAKSTQSQNQKDLFLAQAKDKTEQALKALIADVNTDNRDIAYSLSWQLGRILKTQGKSELSLSAYEFAFQSLKSLRTDLVAINQDIQFDFRERVEPFYREFIELLLQSEKPPQENIDKARDVIESFQLAELDNYFQNPCSQIKQEKINDFIDKNTQKSAVIYPIFTKSRLEIILKLPNTNLLHHYKVLPQDYQNTLDDLYYNLYTDVEDIFKQSAEDKIKRLEENKERILPLLKKVYGWLIEPIKNDLEKSKIETLVFVLDAPLQSIPMAALYDGEKYLIENYKVAFTPGLQLTESKGLQSNLEVLAAGVAKETQGRRALPAVKRELDKIQSLLPQNTTIILDEKFTKENLIEKLKLPFSVLHLATHGEFSSNPNKTYILTEDSRILGNELDRLLRARNSSGLSNLELLVLSACETAKGDRRAVLGLAGIAVRAGARSTVATLWSVEDESAAILISEFYKVLKTKVSKAEALRQAQLNLLMNPNYEHLAYWAPYVLVGNWN